jgi:hypothetical protein
MRKFWRKKEAKKPESLRNYFSVTPVKTILNSYLFQLTRFSKLGTPFCVFFTSLYGTKVSN